MPELVQGTDEWLQARCGMLTASVVGKLITPTLRVASNDISRAVTLGLVAERITGYVEPLPMTSDMWRGVEDEPKAREAYAVHKGVQVEEIGFMVRDFGGFSIGYSPDGLVGDEGLIECKSRIQRNQVRTILDGDVPAANMAQLQCGLLVSGRDWIDYVSYSGGLPLWIKRVTPDERWFAVIEDAALAFEEAADTLTRAFRAAAAGLPMTERTPDYDQEIV